MQHLLKRFSSLRVWIKLEQEKELTVRASHKKIIDVQGTQTHIFLMGQPRPLCVYFPFSHQVESNSDRMEPSRPLYPLDHNHGPLRHIVIVFSQIYIIRTL